MECAHVGLYNNTIGGRWNHDLYLFGYRTKYSLSLSLYGCTSADGER